MRAWHRGWCRARLLSPDPEHQGVLRTRVGDPGRDVERLVLEADAHPRRLDAAAHDSWADRDPWITVPTLDPGRTADRLAEHGLRVAPTPEWLMTVALDEQRRVELPTGCALEVLRDDPSALSLEVRLVDAVAARGQVGLSGPSGPVHAPGVPDDATWAVPDRITTGRAFRRRGLGGALMTVLADAARERGATHGVLVASDQGRALYTRLGWAVVGAVVVARRG